MNLWTLLPVKPFEAGKSRLASVLDGQARTRLARCLFLRTLETVLAVQAGPVLVVSRDEEALKLAARHGAQPLQEAWDANRDAEEQLNAALGQAIAYAQTQGADGVLILPTDLPRLTPQDVAALVQWIGPEPGVLLAPSATGGTNALLLVPPDVISPAFGPGSAARHQAMAQAAGASVRVCRRPGLVFDLDTPEDWQAWRRGATTGWELHAPQTAQPQPPAG